MAADTRAAIEPTPIYRITLEGRDLTPKIEARLVSLTLTDNRGFEADELDLTLDDSDGLLDIPSRGATLTLAIGWAHSGLIDKGTFTVDEIEHTGAPDKLQIRARSADMRQGLTERRERSFHRKTLGDIIRAIAGQNELKPVIAEKLAGKAVDHIDQTSESDANFLTRLAQQFDAIAAVKAGRLLFLPTGEGVSATGKALEGVTITRAVGDSHRFAVADREIYTQVQAYYQDVGKAKKGEVLVGKDGVKKASGKTKTVGASAENTLVLRHTYASKANAERGAKAAWNRIHRGRAEFSITLALGRPDLFPEMPVRVSGFKPVIDGTGWTLARVVHTIAEGGFTSQLELEMKIEDLAD
jgi:phage protein D